MGEGCFLAVLGQWGRRPIDTKSTHLTQSLGSGFWNTKGQFCHTGHHLCLHPPVLQLGSSLAHPLPAALDHNPGLDPAIRAQEHLQTGCILFLLFSGPSGVFLVARRASLLWKFLETTWMSLSWGTLFLSQRMMTSMVYRRGTSRADKVKRQKHGILSTVWFIFKMCLNLWEVDYMEDYTCNCLAQLLGFFLQSRGWLFYEG